jgi:8-oxo-dGTP diphosphatase
LHNHEPYTFCPKCAAPLVIQLQMGEERPTCPVCGWVHYEDPKVAVGVLLLCDGKVLLVRRVMEPFIGCWSIPAGFVNAFEDPQSAAVRECLEETGLQVNIDGLFDVRSGREHPRGSDILLVYTGTVLSGELTASDDADAAAWFPLDTVPLLAFESTKKVLAKAALPA